MLSTRHTEGVALGYYGSAFQAALRVLPNKQSRAAGSVSQDDRGSAFSSFGLRHSLVIASLGIGHSRRSRAELSSFPEAFPVPPFEVTENAMNELQTLDRPSSIAFEVTNEPIPTDASANPFRLVVDPMMRMRLRKALFELIETHDREMADYVAEGKLALDSYKEYIELFARSLRETMNTREGVAYLLESCGFAVNRSDINLNPDTRWR
jgi:hypothetical protein